MQPRPTIEPFLVSAEQMRQIEGRLFAVGMPVAALMEKVAGQITRYLLETYLHGAMANVEPSQSSLRGVSPIGVVVGPGHNGGDALVVARELFLQGYDIRLYRPLNKLKPLTASHAQYAESLGIPITTTGEALVDCGLIVDGLFGFGLTRALDGAIASLVKTLNSWTIPVISLDLPSGIHTDTGRPLGVAIRATRTLCLGLWKRAFVQDCALDYLGQSELIDFGIPLADIQAVLGHPPAIQRITPAEVRARLPLPRTQATHKYQVGHLLLICGSRQFAGAAILSGLGARASGVGMVTIVVPESLRLWLVAQIPEALVVGAEETELGAIAGLPNSLDLNQYSAIACGPGLTREAKEVVTQILGVSKPLLLDADGLNLLAELGAATTLRSRSAPTVLTPHGGEFKRLFPGVLAQAIDAGEAAQTAADASNAVVVLKGARSAIAAPHQSLWINPVSTPALARGGSGDVLTGLTGGLMAQDDAEGCLSAAMVGSWWHAQAGYRLARDRSVLGIDPKTLAAGLIPTLSQALSAL